MNKIVKTPDNPEKLSLIDRRFNVKTKPRGRLLKKANKSPKNFKLILKKEMGWNDTYIHDKLPRVAESRVPEPRNLQHKRSLRLSTQNCLPPTQRPPSESRHLIRKASSPFNLYSFRSIPSQNRETKRPILDIFQLIKMLQAEINVLYQKKGVPQCHIAAMREIKERINKDDELRLLREEVKDLKSQKSVVLGAKTLCQLRERAVSELEQTVRSLKEVAVRKEDSSSEIESIKGCLREMRSLSLRCIERILRWKENIQQFCCFSGQSLGVKFSIGQEDSGNYLLKILSDTKFLHDSGLFSLCSYPDPFFLSYTIEEDPNMQQFFKIRACELLLLEESL